MIRSTTDEPMTVSERYASALNSSKLRMTERAGDLDVIIAAGCLDDSFASALLRVHVEYDLIRSEHLAAEANLRRSEQKAARQKDKVGADGKLPEGPNAAERSAGILADAEAAALTAHALILTQLSTLRLAKEMMGHYAIREAARWKFGKPIDHILRLSGSILDVHISPTCRACRGIGFNGDAASGESVKPCRPCRGSRTRRDQIGADEADRHFAGRLLMEMSALVGRGDEQLRRKSHKARAMKAMINDAEAHASRG